MNILLINPSWGARVNRQRYNRRWPPLDLLNATSVLRSRGLAVDFCDARATGTSPLKLTRSIRWADKVVITTSPLDRWQCPNIDLTPLMAWTSAIPREKLILCGAHGTVFPDSLMHTTGARWLIRGEPEEAILALCLSLQSGATNSLQKVPSLSYLDGNLIRHNPLGPPVDLSALPPPAYDLTHPKHYEYELLAKRLAVLETSRGCPHRCSYCFKSMYGSSFRLIPLAQVANGIEQILRLGYRCVYFMDLEFSLDRSRTVEFCRLIKEYRIRWCCQTRVDAVDPGLLNEMFASGCRLIHYGIESGDPRVLSNVRKGTTVHQMEEAVRWTRSAGMASAGFFLVGLPGETRSALARTEVLARRLNLTYASFHPVTFYTHSEPDPDTPENTPWWELDGASLPSRSLLNRIYLRYYLRPAYWRELLARGTFRFSALRLFFQFLKGISLGSSSRKTQE